MTDQEAGASRGLYTVGAPAKEPVSKTATRWALRVGWIIYAFSFGWIIVQFATEGMVDKRSQLETGVVDNIAKITAILVDHDSVLTELKAVLTGDSVTPSQVGRLMTRLDSLVLNSRDRSDLLPAFYRIDQLRLRVDSALGDLGDIRAALVPTNQEALHALRTSDLIQTVIERTVQTQRDLEIAGSRLERSIDRSHDSLQRQIDMYSKLTIGLLIAMVAPIAGSLKFLFQGGADHKQAAAKE